MGQPSRATSASVPTSMVRSYTGPPSWRFTNEDLHKPLMRENFMRAILAEGIEYLSAGDINKSLALLAAAVERLKEADRNA